MWLDSFWRAAEPCDLVFVQETVDQRRIQREISILRRLTHGSIIQLLEIVETEHFIFLVSYLIHDVLLVLLCNRHMAMSSSCSDMAFSMVMRL